jgi:hypothetical protein
MEVLIWLKNKGFLTNLIFGGDTIYPRKLKVEVREELPEADFQEKTAYSRQANLQVLVKGFTL